MDDKIKFGNAYYVGTHHYSFRQGEPAEIISVATIYNGQNVNVCFYVKYADGRHDYCPVSDTENYVILTDKQVRLGYIKDENK